MFLAGVATGVGLGLAVGLLLGQYVLKEGLQTLQDVIEKVSYSLRWPTPPTNPVQVSHLATEDAFADLETDDERVPSWMDDEVEVSP